MDIIEIINQKAKKWKVDKELIISIINTESKFDEKAYNPEKDNKNPSYGLMQIRINTAKEMGFTSSKPEDLFKPDENIERGTKYLRTLLDNTNSIPEAISAYNQGLTGLKKNGITNTEYVKSVYMRYIMLSTVNDINKLLPLLFPIAILGIMSLNIKGTSNGK